MLINGDLIRVPQGTVIHRESAEPMPVQVCSRPQLGIVINNEGDDLIKVLLNNQLCFVSRRTVQLVKG